MMLQRKVAVRIGLALLCVTHVSCAQNPDKPESPTSSPREAHIAKFLYHLQDDMAVTSIVWSPDGRYIAASSNIGNKIHIWDVDKKKKLPELERTSSNPEFQELAWDPQAGLAVCDGDFGKLKLFDEQTWKVTRVLSTDSERKCIAGAFSSDGSQLAVLGFYLSVYETKSWKLIRSINVVKDISHGIPFVIRTLAYVPGTHTILLGGDDRDETKPPHSPLVGHVFVLEPDDSVPSREFPAYTYTLDSPVPAPGLTRLAVSPDGKQVATGIKTGAGFSDLNVVTASVHILSLQGGSLLGAPLDDQGFGDPKALSYTPNGRYLIVAHGGIHTKHLVHVIETQQLKVVDTVHAGTTVYGLAVRSDSSQFAVSVGGGIDIWSLPKTH